MIKAKQDALKEKIVSYVLKMEIKSIEQLAKVVGEENSVIDRFIRNNRDVIEYSRHDKRWILCSSGGKL